MRALWRGGSISVSADIDIEDILSEMSEADLRRGLASKTSSHTSSDDAPFSLVEHWADVERDLWGAFRARDRVLFGVLLHRLQHKCGATSKPAPAGAWS